MNMYNYRSFGDDTYGKGQRIRTIDAPRRNVARIARVDYRLPLRGEGTVLVLAWLREWAREWKEQTRAMSSIAQKVSHPAYQEIIGMGKVALPFLFEDLRQGHDHWFPALKSITGDDPVPVEHRGNVAEMRRAWMEWGRQHGYA